jgi:hypothetical protein
MVGEAVSNHVTHNLHLCVRRQGLFEDLMSFDFGKRHGGGRIRNGKPDKVAPQPIPSTAMVDPAAAADGSKAREGSSGVGDNGGREEWILRPSWQSRLQSKANAGVFPSKARLRQRGWGKHGDRVIGAIERGAFGQSNGRPRSKGGIGLARNAAAVSEDPPVSRQDTVLDPANFDRCTGNGDVKERRVETGGAAKVVGRGKDGKEGGQGGVG